MICFCRKLLYILTKQYLSKGVTLEIDLSIHNKYMHALSYKYPKAFICTDNFSFSTQLKAPKYAITSLMDLPSMLRVNMDMPQDRPYFT